MIDAATSARIYDLAQPAHAQMPQLPFAPRYTLALLRRHGDVRRDDDVSIANELIVTTCHAGTHMDALGHVSVSGLLHGGRSASETETGVGGLNALDIASAPLLVRRGVLLDAAAQAGVDELPPGYRVDASALQAAADAAKVEVLPGDVVFVRTGWGHFWGDPERYVSQDRGIPGVDPSGGAWLASRGIVATGTDTLMYEAFGANATGLPVHALLLQHHGIYVMENLNLDALARDAIATFVTLVLPLRLVGATGSPVRPVALASPAGLCVDRDT